jgi:HD superfamily phosphodiesterase
MKEIVVTGIELRKWLLKLANNLMKHEGYGDASHDYDHIERVMALADTIQAQEGGDLPERMTTSTGRELARERYEYMKEFFRRLRLEIEGEL